MKKINIGSNETTNLIAIVSIVFSSILSVWFFYANRFSESEKIVFLSKLIAPPRDIEIQVHSKNQLLFSSYFETIISNNSKINTSIIDYDIEYKEDNNNLIFYPKMIQGIYNAELIKQEFPINIAAGESKKFYLKLGVIVDKDTSKIILSNLDLNKKTSYKELQLLLARHSRDIFGRHLNHVYIEDNNLLFYSITQDNKKNRFFKVNFLTGRGSNYQNTLELYKF